MKPFLGIDITTNKRNKTYNGTEFMVQETSPVLINALERSAENAGDTIKKAKLPLPFRIIQYIGGLAAILIASGILKSDVSIEEGYRNAPWLYWLAIICGVLWFAMWIWGKQKSKTVLDSDEATQTFSSLESVTKSIYTELSVPLNAHVTDILSFFYKEQNGNIKAQEKGMQIAPYINMEFKAFSDENNLYIANLESKYAFPLSSLIAIHTVHKHIRICNWNKDEKADKDTCKDYEIRIDDLNTVHCKYYHILELNLNAERYGIYFPSYELPTFEALTGLSVSTES